MTRLAVNDLLARKLSGLESLVAISYLVAVQDVTQDEARAGLHLLESIGPTEGVRANLLREWIKSYAVLVERAIAEGDVVAQRDPMDVSQLLVSIYQEFGRSAVWTTRTNSSKTSKRHGCWRCRALLIRTGSSTSLSSSSAARRWRRRDCQFDRIRRNSRTRRAVKVDPWCAKLGPRPPGRRSLPRQSTVQRNRLCGRGTG